MMGDHPSEARLLLALDRELNARDAARVADHVRGCTACRATWERLEALSDDVERYCRTWPPEPVLVENAATRGKTTQRQLPWGQLAWGQRSWRDRATSGSAVLVAAAAVLLLIGAWIAWARGGSPEVSSSASLAASRATTNAAAPNTAAPARGQARGQGHDIMLETQMTSTTTSITPPKAHHRLARTSTPRRTGPTYYWALPYSNGELPLSEGSVVMRVRLSRDQLRLAGIPLAGIPISDSHDTPDQSLVRAKVLVGADGLPRAISFDQD